MNKFKIYLKWFPIAGLALSSFEEEIKLKLIGIIYMFYQCLCCILWFIICLLFAYNL